MSDIFDNELCKPGPICVGLIWAGEEEHSTKIEQTPEGDFVNSEEDLKTWANLLNNPWSDTSSHYSIVPNYHFPGEWIAEKNVIVYDDVEAHIAANGDSPVEALKALQEFEKEVIDKYASNEEDDEE
jgi:hypothetical protein